MPDNAEKLDSIAARRAACGYECKRTVCASCAHVWHQEGLCLRHDFHVNMDRGTCRDFLYVGDVR